MTKTITAAALMGILATAVPAEERHFAASAKVGTLGVGVDATVGLSDHLNVRGSFNYLKLDTDFEVDDINYDLSADLTGLGLLLDWHPAANNFRISGGIYINDHAGTLTTSFAEDPTIGNTIYPAELIGTVNGDVESSGVSPYIGIGYGNAVGDSGWSFAFDLGLMFQDYSVDLYSDGALDNVPQFQEDLALEEEAVQDNLDDYSIYPVVMIGIGYAFF